MPDLCPYAHQLCADRRLCQVTPAQMLAWHERSQHVVIPLPPPCRDSKKPVSDKALEAEADRARTERLNWVASQVADCPQALPCATEDERRERAGAQRLGLPL